MKSNRALLTVLLALTAMQAIVIGILLGRMTDEGRRADEAERRGKGLEREVAALRDAKRAPPTPRKSEPLVEIVPVLEGRPVGPSSGLAPSAPAPGQEVENPTVLGSARLPIPGYEESLGAVDWTTVGGNLAEMTKGTPGLADHLTGSATLSPEAIGRIQQLNGPLITAAMRFNERVGDLEPNGAFTHPAFASNSIAATLQAAGKPLTPAQTAQLQELGIRFSDEETRRLASYDERTFALRKLVDEARLRDRFFDTAFAALTPEQRAALVDPRHRGRISLDLFSSGLIWQAHAADLRFEDFDGLVLALSQRLLAQLELTFDDARLDDVKRLVASWLREAPSEELAEEADALALAGLADTRRVTASAERQIVLLDRLGPALALDVPALRRVRKFTVVFVPLRARSGA